MGARSRIYNLGENGMEKYCFGVDLGGTTVKMGLFDIEGNMLESYEIPTDKSDNGANILSDIANSINSKFEERGISKEEVCGVGIGVPGPVLDDGTVNKCANLGWGVFNVANELSKLVGVKVVAGNDANVAALGEYWKGSASGCESMVMITLGTGVGGGIILNGKPVNGINGAGGEIGHMPVVYDETESCGCGKKGCLEQVASATGIVRTAKKLIDKSDKTSKLCAIENFSAKDVFDMAKDGDALAIEAVDVLAFYLGTALSNIATVVDPQMFVVGGGVSKAGEYLIDKITESYKSKAFHASKGTSVKLASLGNDAGMYGAARLVL